MEREKKPQDRDTEKESLLDDTLKQVEKQFGKDFTMRPGDRASVEVDAMSPGSIKVDEALEINGYPEERVVEIHGPESSGKTTLALHAIAEVQKKDGRAAFIDAENAISPTYTKNLGVNIDDLILSQPDNGEQALDITEMLIKNGAVDLVAADSVATLVPQTGLDGEMGDANVDLQARMMSEAMRKLSSIMNRNKCTTIFINQLREEVGIMFGNSETMPEGRTLKFYSSAHLDIRHSGAIKNGTDIIGNKANAKAVKNKVAPPFKVAQIEIMYGKGILYVAELLDLYVDHDIIIRSGAWFSYNDEKIGQDREATKTFIKSNPALVEELGAKLREKTASEKAEVSEEKRGEV